MFEASPSGTPCSPSQEKKDFKSSLIEEVPQNIHPNDQGTACVTVQGSKGSAYIT